MQRIKPIIVVSDFEMEMISGRIPGTSDVADEITGRYRLADFCNTFCLVSI